MTSPQAIAFQWDVASYSGWGIYGLNLLLHWSRRSDLAVGCSRPIEPAHLDLDPLERAILQPVFDRSRQLCNDLARHTGREIQVPFAVLHGLAGELMPTTSAHGVHLHGVPSIGIAL